MTLLSKLLHFVKILLNLRQEENDLDEEIRFHIQKETEENIRKGMTPQEARTTAIKAFGGELKAKEDCRESWGIRLLNEFVSDFRFGIRQILKHKIQNLIIILIIAICISASVLTEYLFQSIAGDPYSYNDEHRVYKIGKAQPQKGRNDLRLSALHYDYIRKNCNVYQDVGLLEDGQTADIDIGGRKECILIDFITPEIWNVVNIKPVYGTFFFDEKSPEFSENIVVLNEQLWKKIASKNETTEDIHVQINSKSYKVIGVAPDSFFLGWERADAWIPKIIKPSELHPSQRNRLTYLAFGKLKKGKTPQDAAYQLQSCYERFANDHPQERDEIERTGSRFQACEINQSITLNVPQLKTALLIAKLITLILLAVGCLNVSGILIVRVFSRLQEFAMRRALGASIFRILKQIYTEVIIIFLIGGAVGISFLIFGFVFADFLQLDEIPWAKEWSIEFESIRFTIGIVLTGSLLSATLPILFLLRKKGLSNLRNTTRTASASASKNKIQSFFVISQVSITFVMLVLAIVLFQNLLKTMQKDVGIESTNRLAIEVVQPAYRFGRGENAFIQNILPFQERLLKTLGSIPGTKNLSTCNRIPLSYEHTSYCEFDMSHYQYATREEKAVGLGVTVRPNYFDTIGTKLLRGRDFSETDNAGSEPVVIISTKTAEKYYQGIDPLGRILHIWGKDLKIIGVVESVQDKPFFMDSNQHTLYFPSNQWHSLSSDHVICIIESNRSYKTISRNIANVINDSGLNVPIKIYPIEDVVKFAAFPQRLPLYIVSFSGLIAILTSILGIYGLVSFSVKSRTREFGIRMALGAAPKKILNQVLIQNIRLITTASVIGILSSILILTQTRSAFPEINPLNTFNFVIVTVFIFATTLVAVVLPASRIIKIDVIESLRFE